jgi:GNAT superfamily N-acetyltransferase
MRSNLFPALRLREADRAALEAHFLALDGEDRRLRFGASLNDDALKAYVSRIDFEHDGVFASRDFGGRLLAAIHVPVTGDTAELGLSVLERYRGFGLGNVLFARAMTHLRNRGVRNVFVHCLAENGAMLHLARKYGMRIVLSGSESNARLELAPADAGSHFMEWLDESYARSMETARHTARFSRAVLGLPV